MGEIWENTQIHFVIHDIVHDTYDTHETYSQNGWSHFWDKFEKIPKYVCYVIHMVHDTYDTTDTKSQNSWSRCWYILGKYTNTCVTYDTHGT